MLEKFPQRLKTARETKNISQRKLGMILGLSDKAISAYESGRTFPPLDTLLKIAKELSKPVSYFLDEDTKEASLISKIDKLTFELKDFTTELEETRGLLLEELKNGCKLPPITPEG
jgi:transcriptional regulator with XRE-family HTH domain